jgi:hypothetical protein
LPYAVVSASVGPGYDLWFNSFLRVKRGGRIFFVNDRADSPGPHQYAGTGFDSGVLQFGQAAEVAGVSALAVGHYKVYDRGVWVADLYIDP